MPRKKKTGDIGENTPDLNMVEATLKEPQKTEVEQKEMKATDLKVGYVVGLTPDGNFIFELLGSERGLVELLGIHQHATKKVNRIYDEHQLSGDRLTHEVGKAVAISVQKIDQLLSLIAPQKPDNNLG